MQLDRQVAGGVIQDIHFEGYAGAAQIGVGHEVGLVPLIHCPAEYGAQDFQHAVSRRVTDFLIELDLRDPVNQGAVDLIQGLAIQEAIEPAQMNLVRLDRCLVVLLLKPANNRVAP